MKNLLIIGAGGFGREVHGMLWDFVSADEYRFGGFLADDAGVTGDETGRPNIIATPADYQPQADDRLVLAIGNMPARVKIVDDFLQRGGHFLSLIHPTALIADNAALGRGLVVYPFTAISNGASIGDYVHLNLYASVGHDAQIGRCALLAPYATVNGFGVIEEEVYLSTHSTIAPQAQVGARSKVSANSAVMKSVPADSFVFGVPGRRTPRFDL